LSPEKGFADLIGAVVSLQKQGLAVDLWIAGEGPERGRLNEIIESSPAQGSIRLLGQMEDPRLFFEAMDLFVLNSVREGLPNVLLEAMAMETPAMATDTGGISALLRDGETGYLIPPESHSGLGQALRAAIASPGARTAMASAGRELIERDFGFDARIKKIASIYYRQLQQSGHFHRRSSGRLPLVPQG
jgi:glycosyltransferase involved in cell wall biosynthesis